MVMIIKVSGSDLPVPFKSILENPTPDHIAEWGLHLAEAERELAQADAHYRAWRARQGKTICDAAKKGAPSEWKVKQAIDSVPDFITYKNGIADAHYNVRLLSSVVDAVKAALTQN